MIETIGEAFKRLRLKRELSLRQLGRAVPVDSGLLSRIENDLKYPSDSLTRAVDSALRADGELILLKKVNDAKREPVEVASDPVNRRTFVTRGAALAAVATLPAGFPKGRRVGAADVERIQDRVDRLYAMEYAYGGESLWQAALGYAQEAYMMLDHGTFSDAVGKRLMEVAGRMQMCAGWLAFDAGHQDVARSAYNEALGLARQADDAEVETHALANLAFQSNVTGAPRQAARWAEAANRAASATDRYALLAVIPQLRLALASALAGERSAFEKAMTRSRKKLDADFGKPVEAWCSFLTPAELDGIDGTCALELGDSQRAVRLLTSAIAQHGDDYSRGRAIYRVRLSRAHLGSRGDLEHAVAVGHTAIDDRKRVASWRLDHELGQLAADLRPHNRHSDAKTLLDRLALIN